MDDQNSTLLTIIICTYNRAKDLKKLLEQILSQCKALYDPDLNIKALIELIIVDNNSKDQTADLIFNLISEKNPYHPDIKYILEQKQGSSFARNRGIKESTGNLITFLDDDISIEKDWLKKCFSTAKAKPSRYVAGARVVPVWQEEIPAWLNLYPPYEIIQSCFPAHDYGNKVLSYPFELSNILNEAMIQEENPILDEELQEKDFFQKLEKFENKFKRKVQNPISACFLASRDIFINHGLFREDLGIIGDRRGACEDTEFFWRLIAAGINVIYQPGITIYHPIPRERMTQDFVLRWYELIGYTLEYMKSKGLMHLNPEVNYKHSSKNYLQFKKLILLSCYYLSFLSFDQVKTFWFKAQIAKLSGEARFSQMA